MLSLPEARAKVLAEAGPGEPIEMCLKEALGLVLAEPLLADVDLPPFDRAGVDGYAVRASDAPAGASLEVMEERRGRKSSGRRAAEITLGRGESARVRTGDALPVGADAVLPDEDSQPETALGAPREFTVLRDAVHGGGVVPRGYYLRAGASLASAGTRLRLPMVGLLASQGCVHPVCYRRARVAAFAVGDHLVGPADAPVMHRERNAAGPTVVAPCLRWGATAHDLGVVPERNLAATLDRALTASVVVVLGEMEGAIPKALWKAGVEPVFEGVAMHPGKRVNYGVVRDDLGQAAHHVFHMAPGPVGALTATVLLIGPLLARLHGEPADPSLPFHAVWSGSQHMATDDRLWAVPVTLEMNGDARLRALPIEHQGKDDLAGFSRAEALALLPPGSGPWDEGQIVPVVPMDRWPGG